MGKRRKGREIVMQSTYASLISGANLTDTLADQLGRRESAKETAEFATQLMDKVQQHRTELEQWLHSLVSANWRPERLGVVEKVILTLGLAELKFSPEVPYRVAINEALELTRRYCDEEAVGFVNGVLDTAASQVYPDGAARNCNDPAVDGSGDNDMKNTEDGGK